MVDEQPETIILFTLEATRLKDVVIGVLFCKATYW